MQRSSSILMLIFGLCLGTFGEYCVECCVLAFFGWSNVLRYGVILEYMAILHSLNCLPTNRILSDSKILSER